LGGNQKERIRNVGEAGEKTKEHVEKTWKKEGSGANGELDGGGGKGAIAKRTVGESCPYSLLLWRGTQG